MGILEGRVVLITDTGTNVGYHLALAISAAGARVVVNDKTNAGSVRAAADALVTTIKRRGGPAALPAYGGFKNIRDCMQMVGVAPDRWDWVSGIVHIGPGADDLRLLLRAAQPTMSQWGGMLVSINADDATGAVVTEQAESLSGDRITLNAIRAGDDDITSMVCYLLSHHSSGVSGKVVNAAPDHTAKEIAESFDAIVAAQSAPAKPAAKAAAPAEEPAAKPAAPAAKPAVKAAAPAAKPAAKPVAKAAAPAAKPAAPAAKPVAKAAAPAEKAAAPAEKPAATPNKPTTNTRSTRKSRTRKSRKS